jgi:putative ABC transport system substrate-binding protein
VVDFEVGSGVGGSGTRRWNTRRGSDHAAVLAYLDAELQRLPVGISAGVLGNDGCENGAPHAILITVNETKDVPRRGLGEMADGKSLRRRGDRMGRLFLAGVLAIVCAAVEEPRGAGAQQPDKVARVGVLWPGQLTPTVLQNFARFGEALGALGWVEGRNLVLDYRAAEGRPDRVQNLAAALVATQPDVILTPGGPTARAVQRASATIPVVFVAASDPVKNGLVQSFSRPGGNLTGTGSMGSELDAKRLELLKDAFPRLKRIAVVWNPTEVLDDRANELRAAGGALGVELVFIEIRRREEFPAIPQQIEQTDADALAFLGDPAVFGSNAEDTIAFAAKTRLPAIFPFRRYVAAGGLLSYGASLGDLFARSAGYVDKILKGAKPADLPVEQPTKFELVVNLKTAEALGLTIPRSILARADEVIE